MHGSDVRSSELASRPTSASVTFTLAGAGAAPPPDAPGIGAPAAPGALAPDAAGAALPLAAAPVLADPGGSTAGASASGVAPEFALCALVAVPPDAIDLVE